MFALQHVVNKQYYYSRGELLTFMHPDNAGWWIHNIMPDPLNWVIAYIG